MIRSFKPDNFDIMGRESCMPCMPCKVCRLFNEWITPMPKGFGLIPYEC